MGERIPVILYIDVEADPPSSRSYEGRAVVGLRATLSVPARAPTRMADASGSAARLNWFWRMDPQVELVYGSSKGRAKTSEHD